MNPAEKGSSVFNRAMRNIDRLADMKWQGEPEEQRVGHAKVIKERLQALADAPSLKLEIMGDTRSLEPYGSETWGEGIPMSEVVILFDLEHTMEFLSPNDPVYKQDLEGVFGKPVNIIDLGSPEKTK
jgi:hypothetical protein